MNVDYLIVGSGLTGAVIARILRDAGKQVLVVDRRNHLGGNVFDHSHPSGIRIHTYGPHYFRTSSDRLWQFVNRFSSFYKFEATLMTEVDGKSEFWPVTRECISRIVGNDWKAEFQGTPQNFEEASLAIMPRLIYEKFVKGYSEKQWGVSAARLSARLAGRFEIAESADPRLKKHRYQGIPENGYAGFMQNLLQGIPLILNYDYLEQIQTITARQLVVFTGPIDEYFRFSLGKLSYRGQKRQHQFIPDVDYVLPTCQVNNPDPSRGAHVRTLEWKQMMDPQYATKIKGSVLTTETPWSPENSNDYEYPFPDDRNQKLYAEYEARARATPGVLICGRLGEYRYYDMDQAIGRAIVLAEKILGVSRLSESLAVISENGRSLDLVAPGTQAQVNSGTYK